MNCGVGCRCGSDPELLWLWFGPAAATLIRPLAWGLPYGQKKKILGSISGMVGEKKRISEKPLLNKDKRTLAKIFKINLFRPQEIKEWLKTIQGVLFIQGKHLSPIRTMSFVVFQFNLFHHPLPRWATALKSNSVTKQVAVETTSLREFNLYTRK